MGLWERFKQIPEVYRAGSLLVVVVFAAAVASRCDRQPEPNPAVFQPAPSIKAVASLPRVEVKTATGTVKVFPKARVTQKVALPESIGTDPAQEVSATAVAAPSEGGTEILSVLDTTSGETRIVTREVEPPFIAFENKRRIGLGYGIGTRRTEARLFGEWSVLRVGKAHVGVQTEVTAGAEKSPEAKAFVIVDYRF